MSARRRVGGMLLEDLPDSGRSHRDPEAGRLPP